MHGRRGGQGNAGGRLEGVHRVGRPSARSIAGVASAAGHPAEHRRQLGGTRILWEGLLSGEIDVYAEYTGTITEEIFSGVDLDGDDDVRRELQRNGIRMSGQLGFDNTYVIGMPEDVAERRGIRHGVRLAGSSRPAPRFRQRVHGSRRRLAEPARSLTVCPTRKSVASTTISPTAASRAARSTSSTSTPPTPRSLSTACGRCRTTCRIFPSTARSCSIGPSWRNGCRRWCRPCAGSRGPSTSRR